MDCRFNKSKTIASDLVFQKSDNDVNNHLSTKKNNTSFPFVIRWGWCLKGGENCNFSHVGLINASNSNQSLVTPKHMVPCPFLLRKGFCLKGHNCDFPHALVNHTTPDHQESSLPCPNNREPPHFFIQVTQRYDNDESDRVTNTEYRTVPATSITSSFNTSPFQSVATVAPIPMDVHTLSQTTNGNPTSTSLCTALGTPT